MYYIYYSMCMFRCGLHQAAVQGPQALQHGEQLQPRLYELYLLRYIYIIYLQISYSSACLLSHRLQDGECVVFDNMRVLHGRSPFRWR